MPRTTAFAGKFMPVYRGGRWEEDQLVWDDSITVGQVARTLAAQDDAGIRKGATNPGWDELIKVRVGSRPVEDVYDPTAIDTLMAQSRQKGKKAAAKPQSATSKKRALRAVKRAAAAADEKDDDDDEEEEEEKKPEPKGQKQPSRKRAKKAMLQSDEEKKPSLVADEDVDEEMEDVLLAAPVRSRRAAATKARESITESIAGKEGDGTFCAWEQDDDWAG